MPLPELTTDRLWVRPLREDDAGDLHELYADAEAMRYWHHGPSATVAGTERAVRALVHVDAGQFAVGLSGDAVVLGHVGYVNGLEAGGHAGFGYGFRRSAWGQGIAAEATRAVLAWGFDVVGIARSELWIQRDNARSVRLAERLGAVRRSEGPMGLIYGLTASQHRGEGEPGAGALRRRADPGRRRRRRRGPLVGRRARVPRRVRLRRAAHPRRRPCRPGVDGAGPRAAHATPAG